MKLKCMYMLCIVISVSVSFYLGIQWNKLQYEDICLDLGGGRNPGMYPICVIEGYSVTER